MSLRCGKMQLTPKPKQKRLGASLFANIGARYKSLKGGIDWLSVVSLSSLFRGEGRLNHASIVNDMCSLAVRLHRGWAKYYPAVMAVGS